MLATKACGGMAFTGTESARADRGYKYEECGENYYYLANEEALIGKDAASNSWYEGEGHWDYENGKPKESSSSENKGDALSFATMIWKGANSAPGAKQTVGFGIKCGYVLAWYCPTRPDEPTPKQY